MPTSHAHHLLTCLFPHLFLCSSFFISHTFEFMIISVEKQHICVCFFYLTCPLHLSRTLSIVECIFRLMILLFFASPRCGHCTRLKPTWSQLAEMLNTQDESRVRIAKVDCTENHKTCSENEVTSYPTLKFFKTNGEEPVKYRSTRDLPSLTQFINDQLGSSTPEEGEETGEEQAAVPAALKGLIELNDKNFNELTSNGKWFVKFFAPW